MNHRGEIGLAFLLAILGTTTYYMGKPTESDKVYYAQLKAKSAAIAERQKAYEDRFTNGHGPCKPVSPSLLEAKERIDKMLLEVGKKEE